MADTVSQTLKGNFNQILKLKKLNPSLRVLISLGGWTESYRFSDAALPANREAFVASCIDMFITGNVAPGVNAFGVFDGIDVDWQYPGSCGATCDFRTEDRANLVALLAEFRRLLGLLGQENGRQYLLTIAAPARAAQCSKMDLAGIAQHLDWVKVMAYDFHGTWETAGPTNHISALFQSTCEPASVGAVALRRECLAQARSVPDRRSHCGDSNCGMPAMVDCASAASTALSTIGNPFFRPRGAPGNPLSGCRVGTIAR